MEDDVGSESGMAWNLTMFVLVLGGEENGAFSFSRSIMFSSTSASSFFLVIFLLLQLVVKLDL